MTGDLSVRGAREHNLRGVDLDLPRGELVVFTGVSGSGKSSLAFDTLYAEASRRFVEALAPGLRNRFGPLRKPAFELMTGVSPAIGVAQRGGGSPHPRSTVGTLTEVYDLLRVLWARAGVQHCPKCDRVVTTDTPDGVVRRLLHLPVGTKLTIGAPVLRQRALQAGGLHPLLEEVRRAGFTRVRIDGSVLGVEEVPGIDARVPHDLDIVVDRVKVAPDRRERLQDSVATAVRAGSGTVSAWWEAPDGATGEGAWGTRPRCVWCALDLPEPTARLFSFNTPHGACPDCEGLGRRRAVPAERVVTPDATLADGAVEGGEKVLDAARARGIALDRAWREVPWEDRDWLLNGGDGWEGALPLLTRRALRADAPEKWKRLVEEGECPGCHGARLGPPARAVRIGEPGRTTRSSAAFERATLFASGDGGGRDGAPERPGADDNGASDAEKSRAETGVHARIGERSLPEVSGIPLSDAHPFVAALPRDAVTGPLLDELDRRLSFLVRAGLGHLSLDRPGPTLSTGELMRVRLGAAAGNQLSGILYVLDEPTAGLGPEDTDALLALLVELRDRGNTVLCVEHDLAVVRAADRVVDFGPGAGREGGAILYVGPPAGLAATASPTGEWLSGRAALPPPEPVKAGPTLRVRGARGHNLRGVDVTFPLGALVAVTGPSGAGKSSLVEDTLGRAVATALGMSGPEALPHDGIDGLAAVRRLVRSTAGGPARSPRSNAATWTKVWDDIRALYARTTEAKLRGWGPERFSLHQPGGRCEACQGEGVVRVDMALLPELTVPCEVCEGRRYEESTLAATFRGVDIAAVLASPVREARHLFANQPAIVGPLAMLDELGLGYLPLGQPGDTLSGGEAQRLGLARELSRPGDIPGTLYLLDEPSVGLHPADVAVLLAALRRLVRAGGSVVMVEHDPALVAACDHVVRMGPGAGEKGGRVVG